MMTNKILLIPIILCVKKSFVKDVFKYMKG